MRVYAAHLTWQLQPFTSFGPLHVSGQRLKTKGSTWGLSEGALWVVSELEGKDQPGQSQGKRSDLSQEAARYAGGRDERHNMVLVSCSQINASNTGTPYNSAKLVLCLGGHLQSTSTLPVPKAGLMAPPSRPRTPVY